MIIYGSKATLLATEITPEKCNNCGAGNSVQLNIFQKYAHIFWIPFFPINRTAVSQCHHCKQVLNLKEFPVSTRIVYDNVKSQRKTPKWMFSGLAVLAVFILFASFASNASAKRNAARIMAPAAGDVFEVRTREGQYTLYKVNNVQDDSVFIRVHLYETNKISGLPDLKRKGDAGYSQEIFSVTKASLQDMLKKGEIRDIEREIPSFQTDEKAVDR